MKCGKERVIMETGVTIVYLFMLMTIVESEPFMCSPGLKTAGTTYPQGDVILQYGDPLNLYCMLDPDHDYFQRGYNSSHLVFMRGNDEVGPEYVSIVNSTTIFLHIAKPPLSKSMYTCKVRQEDKDVAVCLNHVAVGSKPQEVENFECVSLNWDNLTCTWKPPYNNVETYSALSFRLPRRSWTNSFPCPNITKDTETGVHYCFWDLSTNPPYRQSYDTYIFNLTTFNVFGVTTQRYEFNHYAYLKPNSLTNLTVDHKTPHSALLHWSLPHPMQNFPPGVVHRILYRTDLKEDWYEVDTADLRDSRSKDYMFNLTDLPYAFRYYSVGVAIRSEKAQLEKFWSDYVNTTFRTSGKAPERAPCVNQGGFEITANSNNRMVTVYWEQLEVYEENGGNFTYHVDVTMEGVRQTNLSAASKKGYISYSGLPLTKPLAFSIKAVNSEGQSPNASSLHVPSQEEVMDEPTEFTKIDMGNGTYELKWKAPRVNMSLLESYTVFWCDNSKDRPFPCEGRLKWVTISPNVTTKNLTIADVDKRNIYQFAISANGHGSSSGMVWASCTVYRDKPVGKIKELWTPTISATFIEMKWKLECFDNGGVIKGYRISYCPIHELEETCKKPMSTHFVHQQKFGMLTGLKPYTAYSIQIAIVAEHEEGQLSKAILVTTLEAAPEPPCDVSISELSATSMRVSWQRPLNTNGMLRNYFVYYHPQDAQFVSKQKVENSQPTEVTLVDLLSYTNYTVTVVACTIFCSNSSEEMVVRTDVGVPGVPMSVRTPTEQRVEWDAPRFAGGMLDLYEVRQVVVKEDHNDSEIFNTTDRYWDIQEKACQEEDIRGYEYSVRAINFDSSSGAAAFSHGDRVSVSRQPLEGPYTRHVGEWSTSAVNKCISPTQQHVTYWIAGVVVALLMLIVVVLCLKKAWIIVVKMQNIKVVMPDGLYADSEKDSKPLGLCYPSPKHTKDHNATNLGAPADEESLLESPSMPPASPEDPSTVMSNLGSSSHRANSPTWRDNPYPTFANSWNTDDSDVEMVAPTVESRPYVTISAEPVGASVPRGYVQAGMLPHHPKEDSHNSLPPSYVRTCSILPSVPEPLQIVSPLSSNYVRTAPEYSSAPRVAIVSPFVSEDITATSNSSQSDGNRKESKSSGYVTHNDPMLMNPKTELVALDHPSLSKRVSAPPLYNHPHPKLGSDAAKRTSMSSYTTLGLDTSHPDPACSPEYCRFGGWNSPEDIGPDHHQHSEELEDVDTPTSINIANLGKEKYEMPEDFLSEESEVGSDQQTTATTTTAPHYITLSQQHTLART